MSNATTAPPAVAGETDWPEEGLVQIRIAADHPDAAQRIARLLRRTFVTDEPRSYPSDTGGTRLHVTVYTAREKTLLPAAQNWLAASGSQGQRTHQDEMS